MKNQYVFLLVVFLLAGRMAVGQDVRPVGPVSSGGRLLEKPLIGVGMAIPLYKLFGPKKAKTLPVWDKYRAFELPDSAVQPVRMMSANGSDEGNSADEGSTKSKMLDEVEIKAPRLDPPEVPGAGGGSIPTPSMPPGVGPGAGGGGGSGSGGGNGGGGGSGGGGGNNGGSQGPQSDMEPDPLTGLNRCEADYIGGNLSTLLALRENKNLVTDMMARQFPQGEAEGDSPQNAMRHAFFQALNVCSIGAVDTRQLAQFHEECHGRLAGSPASATMDRFNNAVGIQIGRTSDCGNNQVIYNRVVAAWLAGQLRKIDGSPTP